MVVQRTLLQEIDQIRKELDIALIFITHDLAGAHHMSDRIAVMYTGFLMEVGPLGEVIGAPKHPYTQLLKRAAPKPEPGLEPKPIRVKGEVPDLTEPLRLPLRTALPLCPREVPRTPPRSRRGGAEPVRPLRAHYPKAQKRTPELVEGVLAESRGLQVAGS